MSKVDILSQLLETTWRGISFPTLTVSSAGGHGLVPHKRMDRNGWRVENTGRNSLTVQLRIPFINTIARGRGETWRDLFPVTYRKVLAACEERSTGHFQHPIYGVRTMKAADWREELNPDFRGGPTLDVNFLESVDEGDATALSVASNLGLASSAALSLDATIAALNPPVDAGLAADGFSSFTDFVRQLQAAGSKADLARAQVAAKAERVVSVALSLQDTAGRVDAGYRDSAQRFESAVRASLVSLASSGATKAFYSVPRRSAVTSVANRVKNTIAEILALNPLIAGELTIKPGTVIQHYRRA